jgi:hypothetical protein
MAGDMFAGGQWCWINWQAVNVLASELMCKMKIFNKIICKLKAQS